MAVITGKLTPTRDKVFVTDMNFDEIKTAGGIILKSDNGKSDGVHPRWCRVWAIGPDQTDVRVGEWLLIEHGRWTRTIQFEQEDGSVLETRVIDNTGILLVSDTEPTDLIFGNGIDSSPGVQHRPEDFL